MKRRIVAKGLAIALTSVMLVAGVASAADVTSATSLTLSRNPTGKVAPGTSVQFFGGLFGAHACKAHQTISLVKLGTGVIAHTKTNSHGRWAISEKVFNTARYKAVFKGSAKGVHPDRVVCFASQSIVRVVPVS